MYIYTFLYSRHSLGLSVSQLKCYRDYVKLKYGIFSIPRVCVIAIKSTYILNSHDKWLRRAKYASIITKLLMLESWWTPEILCVHHHQSYLRSLLHFPFFEYSVDSELPNNLLPHMYHFACKTIILRHHFHGIKMYIIFSWYYICTWQNKSCNRTNWLLINMSLNTKCVI